MSERDSRPGPSVPPEVYDDEYFLGECEGYAEYLQGSISYRQLASLTRLDFTPGQRVLDLGCGRGEAALWVAGRGATVWGLDYSRNALGLARRRAAEASDGRSTGFLAGNARLLPFGDASFDRVLMLDIVEHLYAWELAQTLSEVHRVLRPGGRLVVHTAPNLWYYRVGYPVFRLAERLRGRRLPADPKQRFRYHHLAHVNEQSPLSLRRVLQTAGFSTHVWVDSARTEWSKMGVLSRWAGRLATSAPLLRWAISGDIFAIGTKR